jgi:hypothetical protein
MFYPFLVDKALIPDIYQKEIDKLTYLFANTPVKLGQWLQFAEDQEE